MKVEIDCQGIVKKNLKSDTYEQSELIREVTAYLLYNGWASNYILRA